MRYCGTHCGLFDSNGIMGWRLNIKIMKGQRKMSNGPQNRRVETQWVQPRLVEYA